MIVLVKFENMLLNCTFSPFINVKCFNAIICEDKPCLYLTLGQTQYKEDI